MHISSQTISMLQTNISVLGFATVLLRSSLPSLGSKLRLSSVLAVCPSPVTQAWLVFVLWASFQLTPSPSVRHHLPTNMSPLPDFSEPMPDLTTSLRLTLVFTWSLCNISLCGGRGRGRVQMQPNHFPPVGLTPPPPLRISGPLRPIT